MRKIFKILILLLIIAAGIFVFFYFYPRYAQNILIPEIDQVKTASVRLKGDTAYARLTVRLKNKGIFKISIDTIVYRVTFDTLLVMTREQPVEIAIAAGQIDSLALPVSIPYARLIKRIAQLQERDSTDITTDVRVVYNTIFGTRSLSHKKTHRIGTPRPPQFSLEKVEFVKFRRGEVYLNLHLTMKNPGRLSMVLSRLKYSLHLKNALKAEGVHNASITVRPGTTITEIIPVNASLSDMVRTTYKIVTNQDVVDYRVKISGLLLMSDQEKPTEINIEKTGTFELKK